MIPVPKAGLEIGRGAMTNAPLGPGGLPCSESFSVPEFFFVSGDCVLPDCESDIEPVACGRFCWALATLTGDRHAHSPAHKIQRVQRKTDAELYVGAVFHEPSDSHQFIGTNRDNICPTRIRSFLNSSGQISD